MREIDALLAQMVDEDGSDLFITEGAPVTIKSNGDMKTVGQPLSGEQSFNLVSSTMSEEQLQRFVVEKEANFAVVTDQARFRVSAFYQRDQVGMVVRLIKTQIPPLSSLGLPAIASDLINQKRGLVLVVGATGSGKSTSLAALIDHRNATRSGHILTIEDPIEFVHQHKKSLVTQREVGQDTQSFEEALKSSLRQAPDVILIGEIRSKEVMEYALAFAETGHLCVATLHASNANQAIDRILHLVPKASQEKLSYELALNLKGIIAQQLVPNKDGTQRALAAEVLVNTSTVADSIRNGDVAGLKTIMAKSNEVGMQTFDQALFNLYQSDFISLETALAHADSANDLRLLVKLQSGTGTSTGSLADATIDGLS